MKHTYTDEQLKKAVENNLSIAGVLKELGIVAAGGNYKTINNKIKKLNIDTSHFTGAAWNQGDRYKPIKEAQPLKNILVENSTFKSTCHLKLRLFKEGLKLKKCECCNNTEWQGQPIALELHHINGVSDDLRLENLQILCPNCHAFTDNYRGKVLKQ